nr:MAG TPA: hypothetical protein [Caudoviricetes sp.]
MSHQAYSVVFGLEEIEWLQTIFLFPIISRFFVIYSIKV